MDRDEDRRRVLVTGSSGKVGAVIAAALAEHHAVVGIDLVPGAQTTHVGGFDDDAVLGRALAGGVDVLVHVAALHVPHLATADRAAFIRINVDATKRLIDRARDAGARRMVYTSSTSVYGDALVPVDRAVWVTEALAPHARDIYDETKLAAEALFADAARDGLPCTVLRFSRCFPEPLPLMALYRAYRGVDAHDVAQAHCLAATTTRDGIATYNISARTPFLATDCEALWHDAPAVIRQRAPRLAAWFAARGEPLPQRIDRVYVTAKAERELGYAPVHDVDAFVARHAA